MKKITLLVLVCGVQILCQGNAGTRALGHFLKIGTLCRIAAKSTPLAAASTSAHSHSSLLPNYTLTKPVKFSDCTATQTLEDAQKTAHFHQTMRLVKEELTGLAPYVQTFFRALIVGGNVRQHVHQAETNLFFSLQQDLTEAQEHLVAAQRNERIASVFLSHPVIQITAVTQATPAVSPAA